MLRSQKEIQSRSITSGKFPKKTRDQRDSRLHDQEHKQAYKQVFKKLITGRRRSDERPQLLKNHIITSGDK